MAAVNNDAHRSAEGGLSQLSRSIVRACSGREFAGHAASETELVRSAVVYQKALEKADISMRLAMRVRNKLVDTYNEIMRMGI